MRRDVFFVDNTIVLEYILAWHIYVACSMNKFLFTILVFVMWMNSGCDIEEVQIPPEPEVRIVTPTPSSVILDSTMILIEASDDRGIARVELYIDSVMPAGGNLLYEPYEYLWNTQQYDDSSTHILYAKAYDTDSNVTVSQKVTIVTRRFSPSNFTATVLSDTLIRFTWNDHSTVETGFQLFESINDSSFTLRATVPANTTTLNLAGIFYSGVSYTYMVRAIRDSVKSKFSNAQLVRIVLPPPLTFRFHTLSDTLIEFRWASGQNSFEQYVEIEERIGSGGFTKIATVPKGTMSYFHARSFQSGTNYSYRARAFSTYTTSAYTAIITTNFEFPPPTAIMVRHLNRNSVQLSWKDNSTFEKGFAIERLEYGASTFQEIFRTGPNDTTWIDTSLDTAKSYQWRVKAFTSLNTSAYSSSIYACWFPSVVKRFDLSMNTSPVTAVRFVPNSSKVISSYADDAVMVWNAETGTLLQTIKPATNGVYALAVSSDGAYMATGGNDGSIKIWNLATGELRQSITAHSGRVLDVHFNSTGTLLASAGSDRMIKLWDPQNGQISSVFSGHTDSVFAVRIHPNGTLIASGGKDKTVRLWNIGSTSQQWSKSFLSEKINAVAFSLDGNNLAVGQTSAFGNPIVVLETTTGDTATYFARLSSTSTCLEYTPDGRSLLSGSDDGFISLFHRTLPFVNVHRSSGLASLTSLALHPSGSMFATGSSSGTVTLWSMANQWQKFNP